ncbi:unnamed protein product [Paramecium octaurelia]|uniref:Uncharacterized protein n=1 Tax=Paramecium octaurelia TaxID=43137 RepID=A0A8S1WG89_PAROT|nr:unnamed protein product [Paramecium octaurelia]
MRPKIQLDPETTISSFQDAKQSNLHKSMILQFKNIIPIGKCIQRPDNQ